MLRAGQVLQLSVMAMLGLAVVAVHSADMRVGDGAFRVEDVLASKHLLHAAVAVFVMWLAGRINLRQALRSRWWANPVIWLWAASLALVGLAMLPGVGLEINGARRWLQFGFGSWQTNFQPSELTKWTIVLLVAWWCATQREVMARFFRGLGPALAVVAVSCGLIVLQDFGTAALVGLVAGLMLIAGGARVWQLGMFVPPAAGLVVAAVIHKPHRIERIQTFLHPWDDAQGSGYQAIQSMVAFAEGGVTGRGVGNGIQKFGYLPTDTSDMLFAIIGEEMGLAGAALVIGLYIIMLLTGLSIVRGCRDLFGRLIAFGVLATLGIQALINIAVVTVMVPTKGIALPLLSAGGTGWIVTAFALGLVSSLDLANEQAEVREADDARETSAAGGHHPDDGSTSPIAAAG